MAGTRAMSVERGTDASFWRGEAEVQNRAAVRALFAEGKTNGELQPGGRAFCKHSWARRIAQDRQAILMSRAICKDPSLATPFGNKPAETSVWPSSRC